MLTTHLEGLRESMVAFVRYADRAGLRAPVPTCPDWKVRRLIAHQGTIHRWARARLRGEEADTVAIERVGMNHDDPLDWLREGAIELATAIVKAPADVEAPVFLADAGPPREFWARRQCHETTIHAVDALAASLGRTTKGAETPWISEEVALDGIDELLTGFWPRERCGLRSEEPFRLAVRSGGRGWEVEVGPGVPRARRTDSPDGDVVVDGQPVPTYLSLWNRSDEVGAADDRWALVTRLAAV